MWIATTETVSYFLNLAVYLIPLFILATFLVGLVQQYLDEEKIKNKLSGKNKLLNHFLAAIMGAITIFLIATLTGFLFNVIV